MNPPKAKWSGRATVLAVFLACFLTLAGVQVFVAISGNSFLLLCDACVMFVDSITFMINLLAELGMSENSIRDQVNASGISLLALLVLTTATSVLTMMRIHHNFTDNKVDTWSMLGFGVIGLTVDIISFSTFHCLFDNDTAGHSEKLNMTSAWLHVLSDTLRSLCTITVGLILTIDTDINDKGDIYVDSYAALCANALVILTAIPSVMEWWSLRQSLKQGDYVAIDCSQEPQLE